MKTKTAILIIFALSQVCLAATTVLNSFSSGELSPLLEGRTDVKRYYSGCRTLENFVVLAQGGVTKRPGTYYIAEAKDSDVACRLIPFEYSTEQAYIIEMGDEYMRFYTDGAAILGGIGTEDISALDNVKAHWMLNEITGTTVVDSNGATHNGTATADASTLTATGKVGTGCFDLDGQYAVAMTNHTDFSFDDSGTNPFSIACWAYVTHSDDVQNLLSKWKEATAREWRFSLNNERKLQLHLCDDSVSISGAVSHYKLNDDANNTAVDDDIELQDGVATDGTDDLSTTGKIAECFNLDGTYAVEIADQATHSFGNGTVDSPYSIAAWIYVTVKDGEQQIFTKHDATTGSELREYRFYLQTTNILTLEMYDESENISIYRVSNAVLTEGWRFVVMTYTGQATAGATAANLIKLYVDGSIVASTAINQATYDAMENTDTIVRIGAMENASGNLDAFFAYKIDNVILFSVELTQSNITNLWNSGNGTEELASTFPNAISDSAIGLGWHFLCSTYTGAGSAAAADGIILYVDGAAVTSTKTNDPCYVAMETTATTPKIGCQESAAAANEKFWGDKIDEVSIYSDILTPAEVASLYNSTVYEITSPFETSELFETQYVQSADELYFVHPNHPPQKLIRYSHNWWDVEDVNLITGPFLSENTTTTTITPSGTTGDITLTASTAIFNSSHVGALWQITHTVDANIIEETLTNVGDVTSSIAMQVDRGYDLTTTGTWTGVIALQRSYDGETTWKDVLTHTLVSGGDNLSYPSSETVDDAYYRVKYIDDNSGAVNIVFVARGVDIDGIVKVTGYTSPTVVSASVKHTIGGTGAVKTWAEGAWSDDEGYPSCITFYEERQAFAATKNKPQTIWLSQTDDWTNFRIGADDTDALDLTIASDKVDAIRWMSPQSRLLLGTIGSEWSLSASGENEPLTPTNLVARRQSTYGSANLQAVVMNNLVLFVQRQGQKIRSLKYSFELDNWIAPDLTLLSEHITGDGITNIALQNSPHPVLWAVIEDGNVAALTLEDSQEVVGWHLHNFGGSVESIAVIPGDNEDEVWFAIDRTIDSNTVRYIEQMQPFDWGSDQNDIFFVDSGLTYDGAETNSVSGLGHLEGETVSVVGNGVYAQTAVVSSGIVTLDDSYSCMQVGKAYTAKLLPMKLEMVTAPGSLFGQTKRITEVTARLYNTLGCKIGPSWTDYEEFVFDDANSLYSGDVDIEFDGDYETSGNIYIQSDEPTPITVLAIMVRFEKED